MNALDKVVAILEAFLKEGGELRLTDLCEITGLSKSTVYVITHGLIDKGLLTQRGRRGTYFLGVKFIEFADLVKANLNVAEAAKPFLAELCEATNETAELVVRDGPYAVVVASVAANHLLSTQGTGKWAVRIPLHCTACGKVLAAFVAPDEWRSLRGTLELFAETPKTITDLATLERQLVTVRAEGVAVDDEEAETGIRSVAAAVRDASGDVVAAVDIIGAELRLGDDVMERYGDLVKGCAREISKALGYKAPAG